MRRLNLSQFVDFITLKGLIAIARKLEEVYQKADFESIVVDSMINEFVLLRDTQDAATKLRNYMRAIVRQYVDVTDRSEAIRFLRELVAQLELS
jgi:glutamine synthetase